jgi:hypothetical protein
MHASGAPSQTIPSLLDGPMAAGAAMHAADLAAAAHAATPVSAPPRRPYLPLDVPLIHDGEIVLTPSGGGDPLGVRVVPYRPDGTWPEGRRLHPRLYDPFRAFPARARTLRDLIARARR